MFIAGGGKSQCREKVIEDLRKRESNWYNWDFGNTKADRIKSSQVHVVASKKKKKMKVRKGGKKNKPVNQRTSTQNSSPGVSGWQRITGRELTGSTAQTFSVLPVWARSWSKGGGSRNPEGRQKEEPVIRKQGSRDADRGESLTYVCLASWHTPDRSLIPWEIQGHGRQWGKRGKCFESRFENK